MSNGKSSIGIFQEYHNFEISFLKKNYSLVLLREKAHLFEIKMQECSCMNCFIYLTNSTPYSGDKRYTIQKEFEDYGFLEKHKFF